MSAVFPSPYVLITESGIPVIMDKFSGYTSSFSSKIADNPVEGNELASDNITKEPTNYSLNFKIASSPNIINAQASIFSVPQITSSQSTNLVSIIKRQFISAKKLVLEEAINRRETVTFIRGIDIPILGLAIVSGQISDEYGLIDNDFGVSVSIELRKIEFINTELEENIVDELKQSEELGFQG